MNDTGANKLSLKSKYQTYERRKSSCNSALCSVPLFQSGSGWAIPSQTAVKEKYDDSRSDKDKTNRAGTVKV